MRPTKDASVRRARPLLGTFVEIMAAGAEHADMHAAIETALQEMFSANKGLKLHIDSEALRFVTPDVAIEDGMSGSRYGYYRRW